MDSTNSIAQLPNILAGIRAGTNDLTAKDIDKGDGVEMAFRVEAAQNIARKAVSKIDELEEMLKSAGEVLIMVNDQTHPNIECDALGQECLDLVSK